MKQKLKLIKKYLQKDSLRKLTRQGLWIGQYARRYWKAMVLYTLLGVMGTGVSLVSSLISKDLVDIITGHETGRLISTFAAMIGFSIGNILVAQASGYASTLINLKVDTEIKNDIFAKMMVTDWESLTTYHTGDLVTRWSSDASNIASGILNGSFNYNFENNHTAISLKAKEINANDLSYALFDLNNQMYGDLTGDIKLSCVGESFDNCMKTLNGKTTFNVKDGRMPKLGSLEYLLKAGNLLKGGLTSISINSVIDIITPLKTGDFSSISGAINIKDGVAENIEITTKGEDLSLFIGGNYNFSTANAEMEVYGLLSKKISTMFGPIGNLSLNTLFNAIPGVDLSKNTKVLEQINKIPGIELSSKAYRKFVAEIKGNINGNDYVTSFKWIN